MFKGNKYSVISKTGISSVFCFLLLATSNVRMSEGTFCRVEVQILIDNMSESFSTVSYFWNSLMYFHGIHNMDFRLH